MRLLTRNRIRVGIAALLLGLLFTSLRVLYLNYSTNDGLTLPNGREIGGDFVCFYVAGKISSENVNLLYDYEYQRQLQEEIFSSTTTMPGLLPFVYPPFVAVLFAPLSHLSLLDAYFVWSGISVVLYLLACYIALSALQVNPQDKPLYILGAVSFVPFIVDCLAGGQTSTIGFLIWVLTFAYLQSKRDFTAGVILGLGCYKPPLFLIFGILMLLRRKMRFVAGSAVSVTALTFLSMLMLGPDGLFSYLKRASGYTYGNELLYGGQLVVEKGVGLFSLIVEFLPAQIELARLVFIACWCVLLVVTYMRRANNTRMQFATDCSLSLLLSVQMVIYDLTMILIPIAVVLATLRNARSKSLSLLLVTGFFVEFLWRPINLMGLSLNLATLLMLLWMTFLLIVVCGENAEEKA